LPVVSDKCNNQPTDQTIIACKKHKPKVKSEAKVKTFLVNSKNFYTGKLFSMFQK